MGGRHAGRWKDFCWCARVSGLNLHHNESNFGEDMNLQTFTDLNGRIGRQTYWIGLIVILVISVVLYFILSSVMGTGRSALLDPANLSNPDFLAGYMRSAAWQQLIMLALLGFPVFALMSKRLNDRDRPSWMKWLFLAPSIVSALLGVAGLAYAVTDVGGVSMFGPTTLMWIVSLITIGIGLWALIELGFLRGTVGENQHGPDPVG
jgi:uncharacterized membrane protein YhaH (DUF805 family)